MFTALNKKSLGKRLCLLLFLFSGTNAVSQITTVNDSFNDGNLNANPTWLNNTSRFTVSSISPLEGSHSLRSNTGNVVSSIHVQYGTSTNLTSANYSWNLIYRANTNSNPDELPYGAAINTNTNHWRYWIAATSSNAANCLGIYVSHSAGNLKLSRKRNNGTWDITTYPINLNQTYSIKINRRFDGYFEFLVDAGTAEATTVRWQGYITDIFNNGSNNIFMIMHANETSANRFQWDKLGIFTKSLSVSQLTAGVHNGDLEEGMTNKAVIGFSATSEGNITIEDFKINTSSNNNQGTFTNLKLVKSVDDDFSTDNDNTVVSGLTFTLNGDHVLIENLNSTLNSTTENYFFVLDVVNNNGGSPPANIQFSMSCNNCGAAFTNLVTTNAEKVNNFSFSSQVYQMLRVFTWKNTSIVGDFTDNWQNSSAWEPFRTSPSPNDILQFSKGGTVNPLNIPVQTVKKIIIKNNTTVNLTASSLASANTTLTIGGGTDEDFTIELGSSLNVNSTTNIFNLSFATNTNAIINGTIQLAGNAHKIIAASENGIQFKANSNFIGATTLTGNPFGNTTTNSVIFESGATLLDQAGLDYFTNANVLSLLSGSIYKHASTNTASFTNRTFEVFEVSAGATFAIGSGTLTVNSDLIGEGNISLSSGTLNLIGNYSNTGNFTSGSGTVNYSGQNQNIKAANYFNLNLNGNGVKTLLGNIGFANGSSASLNIGVDVDFVCSTFTITALSGSSNININGYLRSSNSNGLLGSSASTIRNLNSPNVNINSTSTIEYNADGANQVVSGANYSNLILTGASIKLMNANISVTKDLKINSGATLDAQSFVINNVNSTSGNGLLKTANSSQQPLRNNLTYSFTVEYYSTNSNQYVVPGTYKSLVLSGARGANNIFLANNDTIKITENLNTSTSFTTGTFISTGNTLLLNGNDQNISAIKLNNLTISGNGNKTLTGDVEVSGQLNLLDNELILENNTLTLSGAINYLNGKIRAGDCISPKGNITVRGTGDFDNLKLNENLNYINNFVANRNGNVNLTEDIHIAGTLTLTQGTVVTNKEISFSGANVPIIKTNGFLQLDSQASLVFGKCNYNGNAFTLPNNLFANTVTFKNLYVGRTSGLTLGNQMINLTGTFKLNAGNLNSNNNITLISNASGTARVDSITCTSCNVIGNVTSQRFIPGGEGKRRWRLVSSPVNVNGSIELLQIKDDMHVTGLGGSNKGFDDSPNNAYSIKTYKESLTGNSNSGWVFPSTIDTIYNTGVGLCLFVRGDRNTPDPYLNWSIPNDAILDFTGTLNIGNINLPVTYTNTNSSADGWNLVANPYASTIDWNSTNGWQKTSLLSKLWLFNPEVGSYGIYDPLLDVGTNNSSRYISSGQAFFVKSTDVNTSLTINERAKVSNTGSEFFRNTNANNYNLLRIVLVKDSVTKDESILYLSENASGNFTDPSDASKMFNDNMNFYLRSDEGYNLSINQHPLPPGPDTIKASVFSYQGLNIWTGNYKFEFSGMESFYANVDVYLEDVYANKKINLRENDTYEFELDNNQASMGNDRFRILLDKNNKPVGIEDKSQSNLIQVYPNPFDEIINIRMTNISNKEKFDYTIYNQFGQEVMNGIADLTNNKDSVIEVSSLGSGVYYINLKNHNYNLNYKLIKN